MPDVDFNYFLNRKYANQDAAQQTAAFQAQTNRTVGNAQANLDNIKSIWLPKESAAGIAKTGAETNLTNVQATWLPKTAQANIDNTMANTGLTQAQTTAVKRANTSFDILHGAGAAGALASIMGAGYQFGSIVPQSPYPGVNTLNAQQP